MPTYVTRPRASKFWDGEDCYADERLSMEVDSTDAAPYFTGILTADGDRLMRMPDRVPLGFHLR